MKKFFKKHKLFFLDFAFLVFIGIVLILFNPAIDKYSDSLMVIITAIYVVATIEICRANMKAADASKEQLAESKLQFEETKRLQVLPVFQCCASEANDTNHTPELTLSLIPPNEKDVEFVTGNLYLEFRNIGVGSMKDITYIWKTTETTRKRGTFVFQSLYAGEQQRILVCIGVPSLAVNNDTDTYWGSIILFYDDVLNNKYEQEIQLSFFKSGNQPGCPFTLFKCETLPQKLMSQEDMDNWNNELKMVL